jgi:hypothetical protein
MILHGTDFMQRRLQEALVQFRIPVAVFKQRPAERLQARINQNVTVCMMQAAGWKSDNIALVSECDHLPTAILQQARQSQNAGFHLIQPIHCIAFVKQV